MLSEKDKDQLKKKGISEEALTQQLRCFVDGFPFLKIISAAAVGKGVMALSEEDEKKYEAFWSNYISGNHVITKFVPASGAASRMFKDLFSFLDANYDVPTTDVEKEFFRDIKKFAFYNTLNLACLKAKGRSIEDLMSGGNFKDVVACLLAHDGLNYGSLPKGLLEFHSYADGSRTPVEEHLVEGFLYATNSSRQVNIHFTVSPEHRSLFLDLIDKKVSSFEAKNNVIYNIGFSEQKGSTDTVAVDPENRFFRDKGELLFRPGGHGALIENLNEIDSDIVFIKNVDNVIPDKLKAVETKFKKIIAGVLVEKQKKAFAYLELLDKGVYTHDELIEVLYFLQNELCVKNPDTKLLEDVELALYLKKKLNRPMRVCGMVKNEGEPGGGPFLTVNSDTTISPQILEGSQIDMVDVQNKEIVKNSSYFNPVDLVCAIRDYKGRKFDLRNYVDPNTGFISSKSKDGKALKALELPGLWNGAMSDWNTIFVEVPIETFNPVKTVNDLLRLNHL